MANIKLVGSHVGVSIGEDGPSQMGLEDLAMMRAVAGQHGVVSERCRVRGKADGRDGAPQRDLFPAHVAPKNAGALQ